MEPNIYPVKIYQIDEMKDKNNNIFETLSHLKDQTVDPSIYRLVFDGSLKTNDLEAMYIKFNNYSTLHPLYYGRSMSVSDVVQINNKFYYCDPIDFKEIPFDPKLTSKIDNAIDCVYVEPGLPAYRAMIKNDIDSLCRSVNGLIEAVPNRDDTYTLCNDEGKIRGMKGNRHTEHGIIAGPFAVLGERGEDFASLPENKINEYVDKYKHPENISDQEVAAECAYKVYSDSALPHDININITIE